MLLVKVKEELQERLRNLLTEKGVYARVWYECRGDEEVVIVPDSFVCDECMEVEIEECCEEH